MTGRISAVIPCAGFSKRMGHFKPLLPLGGRPIIDRVIETVASINPEEIYVIVGYRAGELEPIVKKAGARVVQNPAFDQGMFSSVRIGVKRLAGSCDAFIFLPADIPLVRPATLQRLAGLSRRQPRRLLYPVFFGQRGHPPVIPSDLIPFIVEDPGDGGLRGVLAKHEHRALDVPVADENIFFDLDSPSDYDTAIQRFTRIKDPSPVECEAILSDVYPTAEDIVNHGRQVQRIAVAICRAMNRAGAELDEDRVAAAALLHDIAKGKPDHARAGEQMLKSLGFVYVAELVAAHTDLPETALHHIEAASIVYLADKLTVANRFVSLESRFERAFQRFGDNPAIRSAIEKRQATAMALKKKVELLIGRPLSMEVQ